MGRTLMDPKKDSKWERGRTRQALHFGAHVRGGRAVGAEVEDIPPCLVEVLALLRAAGLLHSPTHQGPNSCSSSGVESESQPTVTAVTAVTVDFFRKGSYSPALPATAPLLDSSHKQHEPKLKPARDAAMASSREDRNNREGASAGGRGRSDWAGGGGSDTEAGVCVLWLQPDGGVVVGSAQELAKRSKGSTHASAPTAGKPVEPVLGEGEGVFPGMERLSVPRGSVMVWDNAQAEGAQVAVPTASLDRIVVSFQTLTPEASTRVLRNRSEREDAKAKAASVRRAAKEAKEAKGPIPGTPVVVSGWRGGMDKTDNTDNIADCTTSTGRESSGNGNSNSSGSGSVDQDPVDDGKTPLIEKEHVQAVYDTIAPHWSHTRYKPWPRVEDFLRGLEACSLVADAGCGNGKYLGCDASGGCMLGSDASVNLLQVCKEKFPKAEVLASDCMRLPYRSGVFDAAISIAVLHHFSSESRRLRALSELCRLLRPGGLVLVYAWAIEQEQDSRRSFAAQDVLVPWHLGDQHNHQNKHDACRNGASTNNVSDQHACRADQTARAPDGASTNNASDQQTWFTDQTAPAPAQVPATHGGIVRNHSQPTPPPPGTHGVQAPNDSQFSPGGLPTASASKAGTCENGDAIVKHAVGAGGGTNTPNQATGNQRSSNALGSVVTQATGDQSSTNAVGSVGNVSAPTPSAPRHGVRIDGVAGAGGSVVYQRYCHMYAEGELEGLVESVGGLRVVKSYYDRSNWCVVAEREV
ncbi:unnamed protein product [Laminaria digitata]